MSKNLETLPNQTKPLKKWSVHKLTLLSTISLLSLSAPAWSISTQSDDVASSLIESSASPSISSSAFRAEPKLLDDVSRLQKSIRHFRDRIDRIEIPSNANGGIFIIGPTGSGKSTLATALAGKTLIAEEGDMGLRLKTQTPIEGIIIGHALNQRGTSEVGAFWHETTQSMIFDCPGFGDPEGAVPDIVNAFSLRYLMERFNRVKIVLVLNEEQVRSRDSNGLTNLLRDTTNIFQARTDLQNSVSLVFTGQDRVRNVSHFLSQQHKELFQLFNAKQIPVEKSALDLLNFLANSPDRVATLPYPRDEGLYNHAEHLKGIVSVLYNTKYVAFAPEALHLNVGVEGVLLTLQYGKNLNEFVAKYLQTEGNQRMIHFCDGLLKKGGVALVDFRTRLMEMVKKGRELTRLDPLRAEEFGVSLNKIFDNANIGDSELKIALETLTFLKSVNPEVTFNIRNWATSLESGLEHIQKLATNPNVTYQDGVLSLIGSLIGLSDIVNEYQNYAKVSRIEGSAGHKLFLNCNFIAPGTPLRLTAPLWEVSGKYTINLSGIDGVNGANGANGGQGEPGQPGGPGGKGGDFYGKGSGFQAIDRLTVITNGGPGGSGGHGGHGFSGANGTDGDTNKVTSSEGWDKVAHHRRIVRLHYNDQGTDGLLGGKGGNAGKGGAGGFAGNNVLEGCPWTPVMVNGHPGADGRPGAGGSGGTHGRHSSGLVHELHKSKKRKDKGLKDLTTVQAPTLSPSRGSAQKGDDGRPA